MTSYNIPHLLSIAVLAASSLGASSALAAESYLYRISQPNLKAAGSAPVDTGTAYVGDGVSKAGACANGKAGCVVLRRDDLMANVSLAPGFGTADLHLTGANGWGGMMRATSPGLSSGKWYYEMTYSAFAGYGASTGGGIFPAGAAIQPGVAYGGISYQVSSPSNGTFVEIFDRDPNSRLHWINPASPLPAAGQVVGIALDLDNRLITFYAPIGTMGPYPVPAGAWVPAIVTRSGGILMNFGQGNFTYPVPAGFNAGVW